jgi:uracil-DNA glycosylase
MIDKSWKPFLKNEWGKPYFQELSFFLKKEYEVTTIFPPKEKVFNAFSFPKNEVKVLILGQDPYHGRGQANGMAFSVNDGVKAPPSLQNIFKEIENEYGDSKLVYTSAENFSSEGIPAFEVACATSKTVGLEGEDETVCSRCKDSSHAFGMTGARSGNLTRWARQGVMLLNTVLTVQEGKPKSHSGKGWEIFTDSVITEIASSDKHIVFMLWGNDAKQKVPLIEKGKNNLIFTSSHPSPFSAHYGFFGNNHFRKANEYLKQNGETQINWL